MNKREKEVEDALLEYVERYGLTEKARTAFSNPMIIDDNRSTHGGKDYAERKSNLIPLQPED